jgi:serine/threonine-protein kinase RsbW/stage II sporulation protein AB (anti-sigma F factor)
MVAGCPVMQPPLSPEVERLELRLEAEPRAVGRARASVVAFAERHGLARGADVALAVTEAVTNAVVHAYRNGAEGQVRVVACARADGLLIVVRDYGCGMQPNPISPGAGLGLAVIGALAGEMNIERPEEGGGTRVRIRFTPPAETAAAA